MTEIGGSKRLALLSWIAISLSAAGFLTPGTGFGAAPSGPGSAIDRVGVSPPVFSPALGQKIEISADVREPGSLSVRVLDRDGFVVRELVANRHVSRGSSVFDWDGRDDHGRIVPDEAYSLKVDLRGVSGAVFTYFPASRAPKDFEAAPSYYDPGTATLRYELPKASRVHLQAGAAVVDPKTKAVAGRVLKTIVNREPRTAGSVIEHWDGFDEGGTLKVSEMPHFVMAIAATTLPENSILCTGNRERTFLQSLAHRTGSSLLPAAPPNHGHHRGLTAIEDVAPALAVKPEGGVWSAKEKVWNVPEGPLKLSVSLDGPTAGAFARQPGMIMVFIDEEKTVVKPAQLPPVTIEVPKAAGPGVQALTVNWVSDYGPVAVNSFRFRLAGSASGEHRADVGR